MRFHRLPVTLVLALLVAAGCNGASAPTPPAEFPTESPPADAPTDVLATTEPSLEVEPTAPPAATPIPPPSDEPSDAPSGSAAPGAADACTGSQENRDFFVEAANALSWTVYCAALPSGWFLKSGGFRQAGGGRLEIAYGGPGGAAFELREGAFCDAADGCVPLGTEAGDVPFGDVSGTLVATDDGGWAIVVDRGAPLSWLAIGTGIAEDDFRSFTAGVIVVGD
jgi:hypothetical protein